MIGPIDFKLLLWSDILYTYYSREELNYCEMLALNPASGVGFRASIYNFTIVLK